MADAIQFTNAGGVAVLIICAVVYLGSCYLYQKGK